MAVAEFARTAAVQPGQVQIDQITSVDRKRVSGPGLRMFRVICDTWGLSEKQRIVLLGDPARSTYHQWMKKAVAREALNLPFDTLVRVSAVLGVHKALTILFPREDEAMTWLSGPHRGVLFGNQSPLDVMLSGTQDGILTVRRYLDGWRGGLHGGPVGEGIEPVRPVRPEDIVFV